MRSSLISKRPMMPWKGRDAWIYWCYMVSEHGRIWSSDCIGSTSSLWRRLSEEEAKVGSATVLQAYGRTLEKLASFKYLGHLLADTEYYCP